MSDTRVELDFILGLERRVWQALVAGDRAAYTALLAPEFLGVYDSGLASRSENLLMFERAPTLRNYLISEARLLILAGGTVLLSYRAEFERQGQGLQTMFVSSIWQNLGEEKWVNVFSQDTAAAPS